MLKKTLYTLYLVLISTSLFAFTTGESIIYPTLGLGFSAGEAKGLTGPGMGQFIDGDSTLFKDGENQVSFAYNFGFVFDYFITDSLSFTSGLTYDSTPYKMKYPKNTATEDLEFEMDLTFLTVPIGAHFYIEDLLIIGGGFYYGIILSDDGKISYGSNSVDAELNTNNDLGLFLDLGLNFNLSETNNIIAFIHYKRGLVNIYDEEDIITDIKVRAITINVAYGIKI